MTPAADLLRAVIARPDDDLPRLLYADWLEERGEAERAEFIRVQCELAALGDSCPPDDPAYCAKFNRWERLTRREQALLPAQPAAIEVLSDAGGLFVAVRPADYRRGLVEAVSLTWDAWRDHAAALRAATPLRRVRLTTWPDAPYGGPPGGPWPGLAVELPAGPWPLRQPAPDTPIGGDVLRAIRDGDVHIAGFVNSPPEQPVAPPR